MQHMNNEELAKHLLLHHDPAAIVTHDVVQLLLARLEDRDNWGTVDQLESENDGLEQRIETLDDLLESAGDLMYALVAAINDGDRDDIKKAADRAATWIQQNHYGL